MRTPTPPPQSSISIALVLLLAVVFATMLPGRLRADPAGAAQAPERVADVVADEDEGDGADPQGKDDPPPEEPQDEWDGPTTFTREEADRAIEKGVRYLRSRQQASGTWGEVQGDLVYGSGERAEGYGHPAGLTSLSLYALRKCKVPMDDESVKRGFRYLRDAKPDVPRGTYECSMLLLALTSTVDEWKTTKASEKARRTLTGRDKQWARDLVAEIQKKQRGLGWRYQIGAAPASDGHEQDLSSTQLVALSLFAAERVGLRVDRKLWEDILAYSMQQQEDDGPAHVIEVGGKKLTVKQRGFSYIKGYGDERHGAAIGSMTACGLANVAMARYVLTSGGDPKKTEAWNARPDASAVQASLYDALAWLDANWSPFANPKSDRNYYVYWLYSVERAMDLVGLAKIGEHLWYSEMGQELINRQNENGSWTSNTTHRPGDVLDTCFALLFLRRATTDQIPMPTITPPSGEPAENR
jgi:hypothetical protein